MYSVLIRYLSLFYLIVPQTLLGVFILQSHDDGGLSVIKDLEKLSSVLLTQYCSGDKIEKNEMGGACSAYGGEMCIQGYGRET